MSAANLQEPTESSASNKEAKLLTHKANPNTWEFLKSRFSALNTLVDHAEDGYTNTKPSPNKSCLVVFANPRSGGNNGLTLAQQLGRKLDLDSKQIHILNATGPSRTLNAFRNINHTILIMGGDGSIGWVLTEMDKIMYPDNTPPPVIVLPMGTGNDLARSLKFGASCSTMKELKNILQRIDFENSTVSLVDRDRWKISISRVSTIGGNSDHQNDHQEHVFNNYFSLGCDAKVSLKFHNARESNEALYKTQLLNHIWYGKHSITSMFNNMPMQEIMNVTVDGQALRFPHDIQCIVFLNIDSYAAGCNPWKKSNNGEYEPQRGNDKLIEILGFKTLLHAGFCKLGLNAGTRLAQGTDIVISLTQGIPAQVDGEAYMQGPSEIRINHYRQNQFYKKTIKTKGLCSCCS